MLFYFDKFVPLMVDIREFKQIATASLTTATGSKIIHLRVIAHVSRSHPAVAGNPFSTPVLTLLTI